MYCDYSSPTLTNCTISWNSANVGGGILCGVDGNPTLTNCILWHDKPQEIYLSSGTPLVSYSDVQGGYTGTGNTYLDPLFMDPNGPDNDPNTWEDNDYRLAAGSSCIDAGKNAAVPPGITTDLDGLLRFISDLATLDCQYVPGTCGSPPIVDMGAYEYQAPPLLLGDLNCDDLVNTADIPHLVQALVDPPAYDAQHDGDPYLLCYRGLADMNQDGRADGRDIQLFTDLLLTP